MLGGLFKLSRFVWLLIWRRLNFWFLINFWNLRSLFFLSSSLNYYLRLWHRVFILVPVRANPQIFPHQRKLISRLLLHNRSCRSSFNFMVNFHDWLFELRFRELAHFIHHMRVLLDLLGELEEGEPAIFESVRVQVRQGQEEKFD